MADPSLLIAQALNDLRQSNPVPSAQRIRATQPLPARPLPSWSPRPDVPLQSTEYSPSAVAPRSGSQLYAQRLASLRAGRLYTRMPIDSFSEIWQRASHQPTYDQWRKLLALEARAAAWGQGERKLSVVLGDSLSLWFPYHSLPQDQLWLNQGISGDTTRNILLRLPNFARTRPNLIYVMAGVNDLKLGATDNEILWNLQSIMRRLRQTHPQAKIVMQSILPTRSPKIQHQRIAGINRRLKVLAQREGSTYLDLYSQFVDVDGQMVAEYTIDGIHLSRQGYATWQNAMQQTELQLAQGG